MDHYLTPDTCFSYRNGHCSD
uniref:Uncharacterized protein n=1 Tax=Anguilla anguilla TaxID=7936 RepID=A0A0E9PF33_ANGAN